MITDYYCFLFPLKVGEDPKVKRNVRERDHYLFEGFRFPRKENRMPEKWEKQTVPKQETVHTDEKHERQWEARADKPRTTDC